MFTSYSTLKGNSHINYRLMTDLYTWSTLFLIQVATFMVSRGKKASILCFWTPSWIMEAIIKDEFDPRSHWNPSRCEFEKKRSSFGLNGLSLEEDPNQNPIWGILKESKMTANKQHRPKTFNCAKRALNSSSFLERL